MFWFISNQYPDLVTRLHVQIRLMGNFSFSACVPWTIRADGSLCFVCKEAKDDLYHFLFVCPYFRKNFDSLWSNLDVKASNSCPTDNSQISALIKNLDQNSKALLLLGCLLLPFDSIPGGGLGIPTDRDQRSWVFLSNPKNTLALKENPKKYFPKSETLKNILLRHNSFSKVDYEMIIMKSRVYFSTW